MAKDKIIVAIGGGEIGWTRVMEDGSIKQYPIETLPIDKEIIKLSGKDKPNVVFLPTASGDSSAYFESFKDHFSGRLGCNVRDLKLCDSNLIEDEIENALLSADIIYVGGGNTISMLEKWRELGVDKLLIKAYEEGVVMSGLSAGAICWFDWVDNFDNEDEEGFKPELAKGLGLIEGTAIPHYETISQHEKETVQKLFKEKKGQKYYGIDNCSAIVSKNGKISFVSFREGKCAKLIQTSPAHKPKAKSPNI